MRATKVDRYSIASGRASFYDLLVSVFERLPDRDLLAKIRDGEFERLLSDYRKLGENGIGIGLDLISSYRIAAGERADSDLLTQLAVDWTAILRGTGDTGMKPAYEGVYSKAAGMGDSVLGVKKFYRKAGLVPEDAVTDAADFLCVELDFMKELCLREDAIANTIELQEEFLRVHLGSWVGEFCNAVQEHASTDFYRGFALILDAYIRMERKRLASLVRR